MQASSENGSTGGAGGAGNRPDPLLYLTDEQLRQGIEMMFFAYRDFTSDPDRILAQRGYGRAHHRAIHFIKRRSGISVVGLLDILRVTKQSLSRVLRRLMDDGLVVSSAGESDRRLRLLYLSEAGENLERALSEPQRARVRRAYAAAGPEAVAGFRRVLERMVEDDQRDDVLSLVAERGGEWERS